MKIILSRRSRLVFSISVIASLILLLSCNVFDTRDAEEPVGNVQWNHFPITPLQTFDNLGYSWNSNENIDRYERIFSDANDSFLFFFDSQDIQDYNLPAHWNKETEVEMRSLINRDMDLEMQSIDEKEDIIQSETAVIYRDYQLSVKRDADTTVFSGSMTLYLQREDDGFWRIHRWEDFRTDDNDTWGRLKYEFITQ